MNANQNSNVVDAEVIEDDRTLRGRPQVVQIPHRAAAAVDAVAETIAPLFPEQAAKMHQHADTVRSVARNVENVAVAGNQLAGSVKSLWKKIGWEARFEPRVQRVPRKPWPRKPKTA